MSSLLERWRAWARADAEARGLAGLPPLIDGLAASLARLRSVDWVREAGQRSCND